MSSRPRGLPCESAQYMHSRALLRESEQALHSPGRRVRSGRDLPFVIGHSFAHSPLGPLTASGSADFLSLWCLMPSYSPSPKKVGERAEALGHDHDEKGF